VEQDASMVLKLANSDMYWKQATPFLLLQ